MLARYAEGQKVRIVSLIDSCGRPNPQIQQYVNEIGTVVKSYCVTRDEFPDLSKMFIFPDVYCYDIRLDDSDVILPGIPEIAVEPCIFGYS